jgi:acyl carrier protein
VTVNDRLQDIFRDVLNDPALELTDGTTAAELPGWDSLAHINVLFAIEETFGVRFRTEEFARLESIGDLKRTLAAKGAA